MLCLTPCAGNGFAAFRGDGMKTGLPLRAWRRSYFRGSTGKNQVCLLTKDAFAFIAECSFKTTDECLGRKKHLLQLFVFRVAVIYLTYNFLVDFSCESAILPASMEVIWIRLGAKGLKDEKIQSIHSCQKAWRFREIRCYWICFLRMSSYSG